MIRNILVTIKLFYNTKCSFPLWSKWFLNNNLFLIKPFLITKDRIDCISNFRTSNFFEVIGAPSGGIFLKNWNLSYIIRFMLNLKITGKMWLTVTFSSLHDFWWNKSYLKQSDWFQCLCFWKRMSLRQLMRLL